MASIMIRDLCATETLERTASLRVKGGHLGYLMPLYRYPSSLTEKFTRQYQSAQVNNTAVGIGGLNAFSLNGAIVQSQSA